MGEDPKVVYRPRPDATPEDEVHTLAEVYRLVLRAQTEKKKGAGSGTLDDDVKEKNAHTAEPSISP